jgi:alcohol sulfotransferase
MIGVVRRAGRRVVNLLKLCRLGSTADAFLVSYPKSGRTWLRFILSNYLDRSQASSNGVDLYSMFSIMPNYALDERRGQGALPKEGRQRPMPLVLVSHHPHSRFFFGRKPIIFLVRDPRDVMVSSYFHATRHKHRFNGSIGEFLREPHHGVSVLAKFLNGWAVGLKRHPHIVLSYEGLLASPIQQTDRVLRFLNLTVDASILRQAVKASDFDSMRSLEKAGGIPDHVYSRDDDESLRMRRGKAGGFEDYLSETDVRFVESELARLLNQDAAVLLRKTGLILNNV